MGKAMRLEVDSKGIATLTLDLANEKVNKLSSWVLEELVNVLDEAAQNTKIQAMLIKSGKPDSFIVGADVNELGSISNSADAEKLSRRGHAVLQQMEALPFPTIAVIDGTCLGGGLELALACNYRIATDNPKTMLGLPEVNLGIIPGWGGTQRLPRLVGLVPGLTMVLQGKPIDGRKAWKMKLVDAWVPSEFAEERTEEFVRDLLSGKGKKKVQERRSQKPMTQSIMESPFCRWFVFKKTRETLMKKTKGQYPGPLKALDLIESSYTQPLEIGLQQEAKTVATVLDTAVAKNLFSLFLNSEELKKDPGCKVPEGAKLKEIKRTAVMGAGVMGAGIAWLFSHKGYPVRLKDVEWDAIGKGFKSISKMYGQLVKIRKLKKREVAKKMHYISGTTGWSGFGNVDIVVEAIVENLEVKRKVLPELEKQVKDDTLICSNTSSLSITEMADVLEKPERFVGLHFFNPVNRMPLVEVVAGKKTSPETVAAAVALMKEVGKTPVVVQDCAGFLVNRILIPSLNESGRLLEEGVPAQRIDKVSEEFGMPMGPFRLSDEVGLDVALKASAGLERAYGSRMKVARIFESIAETDLLGKKGGKGFYIHEGKKASYNPEIDKLLGSTRGRGEEVTDEEILDRILLIQVNEASRCLEEGIVSSPRHVDMGLIMGAGFPPFRGGLLQWADGQGTQSIVSKLEALAKQHGERFVPSDLLKQMAKENKKFYS